MAKRKQPGPAAPPQPAPAPEPAAKQRASKYKPTKSEQRADASLAEMWQELEADKKRRRQRQAKPKSAARPESVDEPKPPHPRLEPTLAKMAQATDRVELERAYSAGLQQAKTQAEERALWDALNAGKARLSANPKQRKAKPEPAPNPKPPAQQSAHQRKKVSKPVGQTTQQKRSQARKYLPNLLVELGPFCQGCGKEYNHINVRELQVDHRDPVSSGGRDDYDNLTLLCPDCNKEKGDRLTLGGLQGDNRKNGRLPPQREKNIKHGKLKP